MTQQFVLPGGDDTPGPGHPGTGRQPLAGAALAGADALAGAVAVVPVFNEEATVLAVLEALEASGIRSILVVDDGSSDDSPRLLDAWATARPSARVVHLPKNRGKSEALRAAWAILREGVAAGAYGEDTTVVCVDADGQHDLAQLPALLARMQECEADLVIARRDLSYHGRYKRIGNRVMAAIGSAFAGRRLHDIESGYRLVRLGPLLHAQDYYRGRRYSEGTELAIVLSRLGYRVDNEFLVGVSVPRTRTSLRDAANHAVKMAGAWFRVTAWRDLKPSRRSRVGAVVAIGVFAAFALFVGTMLRQPVYLGNDSAQSYAHVWAIARSLTSGHGIPLTMPELESGRAYMFPYAAIPWIPAAIARLVLGDWAVTATMGLGVVLLLVGTWYWLPRTATPLIGALMLLNWQLWNGVLQFQLPMFWAFGFACLAAAAFDRLRWRSGTALAVLSFVAHPAMGAIGLFATTAARVEADRALPIRRLALLALAFAIAAPATWMFLTTPSVEGISSWPARTIFQVMAQRTSLLWWPWLLHRSSRRLVQGHVILLLLGVVLCTRNVYGSNPQNLKWKTLPRFPDYISAGLVDPTVRYRVLTMQNQEDGMTQLLQEGALLAQEFFDESVRRDWFPGTESYRCFLAEKGADRVLVQGAWVQRGNTNEVSVLESLVAEGNAVRTFSGTAGTREYTIVAPPPDSCAHSKAVQAMFEQRGREAVAVTRGDSANPLVALTFDDGLNGQQTEAAAGLLEEHGVRGTFFVVGQTLESQQALATRLRGAGHLLGNHSFSHERASPGDARYDDLRRGQAAFRAAYGDCPAYFRPPYGAETPYTKAAVRRAGMRTVLWDVEVGDWAERDPDVLARHVLERVRPGSIVLLHDGGEGVPGADRSAVIAALPAILDGLEARGLRAVTLEELLRRPGYLRRC